MMHCGNCDRGGIKMEIRCEQFIDRGEDGQGEFLGRIGGTRGIRFHSSDKGNAFTRRFKFAVDTEMIAAECAGPDYRYT